MNSKQRDIRKAIAEIENLYPPDNLITNYKNFLKIRDILSFYQFNPTVFHSLVTLTNALWNTTQRINRTSLVEIIKRYASKKTAKKDYYSFQQAELHELPAESIPGIFSIFKKSFENTLKLASKSVEQIQKTCGSLLIDKLLENKELQWLCENVTRSTLILNRILRYPKASKIISKWAADNFKAPEYGSRRPEMISWLIDQEPSFEVERQQLAKDFEYLNDQDIQKVKAYDDFMIDYAAKEFELNDKLHASSPPLRLWENIPFELPEQQTEMLAPIPKIKLSRRFYGTPTDMTRNDIFCLPDFDKLRIDFYKNMETNFAITMLWGIGYSRLNNDLKVELMKKYYSDKIFGTFYKIGKRIKSVELLKWLGGTKP